MTEEKDKELVNLKKLEKETKITSPETIDYLAEKLKEHDLKGIKVGVEKGDSRIDIAVWRESKSNQWKTLKSQDIPTLQSNQNSNSQENSSQREKEEQLPPKIAETIPTNNNSNSGNINNESFDD